MGSMPPVYYSPFNLLLSHIWDNRNSVFWPRKEKKMKRVAFLQIGKSSNRRELSFAFGQLFLQSFNRLFIPGHLVREPAMNFRNRGFPHFQISLDFVIPIPSKYFPGNHDAPPKHDSFTFAQKIAQKHLHSYTPPQRTDRGIERV